MRILDQTEKSEISNQTLHSLFKSYKLTRYPKSDIFEKLTDAIIAKVHVGNCDEQLMSYAVNRLAFINEKGLMLKLHNFLLEHNCLVKINEPQNQVMYIHALAIH